MSDRISAEERVFNLMLALCDTPIGLTKRQIFARVQGYRQQEADGSARTALDRRFERDKELLREAGIPLRVQDDPSAPGDNQLVRYRIDAGALEVPDDFVLTDAELATVGLAAALWARATSGAGRSALLPKMRTLGFAGMSPSVALPTLNVDTSTYRLLQEAREANRWVQFRYAAPGHETPALRTVWPLALVIADERWNLFGILPDGTERTYLLDRIVGGVAEARHAPAAPELPARNWAAHAIEELRRVEAGHLAVVRVRPGSEAEARLSRRASAGQTPEDPDSPHELRFHYLDEELCAADMCAAGPEVLPLAPPTLVSAVRRQRRTLFAAHVGPGQEVPGVQSLLDSAGESERTRVPERLTLLLALVPWALQHPGSTVREAAEAFEVSPERIRSSIRTITVSGIPGQTAAYLPGDLFDIDWGAFTGEDRIFLTNTVVLRRGQRLSRRDLGELLAGLHYARGALPPASREVADRAADKLADLVSAQHSAPPTGEVTAGDRATARQLGIVAEALSRQAQLRFGYTDSAGAHTDRTVTPRSTRLVGDTWYLSAWDDGPHQAGTETRTFRMDRMSGVEVLGPAPEHRDPPLSTTSSDHTTLVIRVDERARTFLSWYAPDGGIPQAGTYRILAGSLASTVRAVSRWSGHVEVLAPESVRAAVRDWAAAPATEDPGTGSDRGTVG